MPNRSLTRMLRINKKGVFVDRAFLKAFLNLVFVDAKRPRAVLAVVKCGGPAGQERICSVVNEHVTA